GCRSLQKFHSKPSYRFTVKKMIRPHSCIYFIPLFPVLNAEVTKLFSSFNKEDSINLYSSLYLNLKELSDSISESAASVFCFDESDKNYILPEFSEQEKIFGNVENKGVLYKTLSEKYFARFNNNLIIFVNTISISHIDILKFLNLLNREDNSLLIGKSHNNKVSYIGFNNYNSELLQQIEATDLKFKNVLQLACRFDYFINVLNGSLFIEDINDFKILYRELSKKESLSYCSHNIHEKFTQLFIEYKELL
ncbi:MAG TPA: hypothetical protein VLN45_10885, partial [Ignavibacteriaceae bacterium]|nr:hypothetical protein [Ignavibacteriaceae bacterium]